MIEHTCVAILPRRGEHHQRGAHHAEDGREPHVYGAEAPLRDAGATGGAGNGKAQETPVGWALVGGRRRPNTQRYRQQPPWQACIQARGRRAGDLSDAAKSPMLSATTYPTAQKDAATLRG